MNGSAGGWKIANLGHDHQPGQVTKSAWSAGECLDLSVGIRVGAIRSILPVPLIQPDKCSQRTERELMGGPLKVPMAMKEALAGTGMVHASML